MISHSGKKIKVGVVGCGVVATAYYLPYLMKMPEANLVAVCDTNPARTAACALASAVAPPVLTAPRIQSEG